MKKLLYIAFFAMLSLSSYAEGFDKYFEPKTLRLDYIHAGNHDTESYYFQSLKEEPYFAGSRTSLIDDNNLGMQYLKVFDKQSGEMIYSRGFCVLFTEWAGTPEAKEIYKAYPESVVMPFPKNEVRVEIHSRNNKGEFTKKFEHDVDPSSVYIEKKRYDLPQFEVRYSGAAESKVDIVFIPEGYNEDEYEKFKNDCINFESQMFVFSPLKENADNFNIRGVWAPSQENGISNPGEHEWKRTTLDAKFYTFGSERYQMVDDFQKVRDIAGNVPYDLIYIISNTKKYGGGAIYNFYGISSAGHPTQTGKVFVHEFGHLLLGLGDEYEGGTAVESLYPSGVEPWEVNLTRLIDFDKKAYWKELVGKSTPIPTKATDANKNVVGVYEGGGYVSKGIYRPWINCMMRTLTDDGFCPVCNNGINEMITFICK